MPKPKQTTLTLTEEGHLELVVVIEELLCGAWRDEQRASLERLSEALKCSGSGPEHVEVPVPELVIRQVMFEVDQVVIEKSKALRERLNRSPTPAEICEWAVQAAAPFIAAKAVEECRERLLHPFLIQAVALECDRLPVDPKTGPRHEDLTRVEEEVRQEIELAFSLDQEGDENA